MVQPFRIFLLSVAMRLGTAGAREARRQLWTQGDQNRNAGAHRPSCRLPGCRAGPSQRSWRWKPAWSYSQPAAWRKIVNVLAEKGKSGRGKYVIKKSVAFKFSVARATIGEIGSVPRKKAAPGRSQV